MEDPSSAQLFVGKIVVVTGAGSGIGKALALAFAEAGAIVVAVDLKGSQAVIDSIRSDKRIGSQNQHLAFTCDVSKMEQVRAMVREVKRKFGRVDIYCSNAGIIYPASLKRDEIMRHSDEQWSKIMRINVQSHVIAARELIPDWEQNKGMGIFVVTASAAGLLTMLGDASYGVSKAAAVSFAEHMAIAHPNIQVHCLCPQAVKTPFIDSSIDIFKSAAATDGVLSATTVADCTLKGIRTKSFWIFPHEKVPLYYKRKTKDHTRWLQGMQRLRASVDTAMMPSKL